MQLYYLQAQEWLWLGDTKVERRVCTGFNRLPRWGEGKEQGGFHLHTSWWQTCVIAAERAAASLLPKPEEQSYRLCPSYNYMLIRYEIL